MKRILVFSHWMELGGAEKALLGLLDAIDTDEYSVDLFLMRHSGELFKNIPSKINILPENEKCASLAIPIKTLIKKRHFCIFFLRLIAKILAFLKKKQLKSSGISGIEIEYCHKFTKCVLPKISNKEYDIAISFLAPHYYVAEKVKAKKKIAWIHTDYSNVKINVKSELKMWDKFDNIISISDEVTNSFVSTFPSLENKITVIENIISKCYIDSLINEFDVNDEMKNDGSVKLLSIGRFGYAKNFDNVPHICKLINDSGLNVKWYIIGFGSGEGLIRQKIAEYNMQDKVIILGKKENPYPYIKACDIYVQPSRYEGKSIAVREAQILGKPVIITAFPTAQSQLNDGIDGVIVPLEKEQCAQEIAKLILDENKLINLSKNCILNDFTGAEEIKKLYQLID